MLTLFTERLLHLFLSFYVSFPSALLFVPLYLKNTSTHTHNRTAIVCVCSRGRVCWTSNSFHTPMVWDLWLRLWPLSVPHTLREHRCQEKHTHKHVLTHTNTTWPPNILKQTTRWRQLLKYWVGRIASAPHRRLLQRWRHYSQIYTLAL